jgi:hypothetical protein
MVVGEFTVSNIAMEEDKREEEKNKAISQLDLDKFKADVAAQAAIAKQVRPVRSGRTLEKATGVFQMQARFSTCTASCEAAPLVCDCWQR